MSSEPDLDRNPSPPPELLQNHDLLPDRIGDSVFSKHWLIKILLDIVEAVNKEVAEAANNSNEKGGAVDSDIAELDSKLEEEACSLWDMSANRDVAQFLLEFDVVDIFLETIEKTRSPRLVEIVIGILGNISSFTELGEKLSENETLVKVIISLTGSSDSPTVIQVLRLIHTGVVNAAAGGLWLKALCEDASFMENIRFMLENSLNGDILKSAIQLLYYILDKDDKICIHWAKSDYTISLITGAKQLLTLSEFEAIDELWLLLNLMFQHDENIAAIARHFDDLHPVYVAYLMRFGDYDCFVPPVHRVAAVAASFTTLATFLRCDNVDASKFVKNEVFLKYVKNMLNSVTGVLEKGAVVEKETDTQMVCEDEEKGDECNSMELTEERNVLMVHNASDSIRDSTPSNHAKFEHSISLHEDDYNSLFILKETLLELCSIVMPSFHQEPEREEIG